MYRTKVNYGYYHVLLILSYIEIPYRVMKALSITIITFLQKNILV